MPEGPQGPVDPQFPQQTPPSTDPHERIDGLRAWLSQLDHTVTVRTWILGLLLLLTLAVAVAGLVIGLQARDSQIDAGEINRLDDRIEAVETNIATLQAAAAETLEGDFATVTEELDKLRRQINNLKDSQEATDSELTALNDEITDLTGQISDLETRIDELQEEIDAIEQQPPPAD